MQRPRQRIRADGADAAGLSSIEKLLCLHVIAEQEILVAYVKFAVGDDRRCPAVFVSALRLVETAELFPAGSRGLDKSNGPFLLLMAEI
jgi:hypothetical protein